MTKLIAEIGFNYIDDIGLCKEMVQAAKDSGAEYAKFQYFDPKYLKPGPWDTDGRREIYEKASMANGYPTGLREIRDICKHFSWQIVKLIRIQYGPYKLGNLKEGKIEEIKIKKNA